MKFNEDSFSQVLCRWAQQVLLVRTRTMELFNKICFLMEIWIWLWSMQETRFQFRLPLIQMLTKSMVKLKIWMLKYKWIKWFLGAAVYLQPTIIRMRQPFLLPKINRMQIIQEMQVNSQISLRHSRYRCCRNRTWIETIETLKWTTWLHISKTSLPLLKLAHLLARCKLSFPTRPTSSSFKISIQISMKLWILTL